MSASRESEAPSKAIRFLLSADGLWHGEVTDMLGMRHIMPIVAERYVAGHREYERRPGDCIKPHEPRTRWSNMPAVWRRWLDEQDRSLPVLLYRERPERAVIKELGCCPRGHRGPVGEDCAECGWLADVLDAIAEQG